MSLTARELIVELVKDVAWLTNGEFNMTGEGTPRIIYVRANGEKISVVYLASTKSWKAFHPFPAIEQEKTYFSSLEEMLTWLNLMGVDA